MAMTGMVTLIEQQLQELLLSLRLLVIMVVTMTELVVPRPERGRIDFLIALTLLGLLGVQYLLSQLAFHLRLLGGQLSLLSS
ncbi:MAG: hypothetical protein ACKO9H_08610, partial [Planctomycetota bacterium]